MRYYKIQPPTDLADYVQFFWILEGSSSLKQPFLHRALADCSPELIFYYKGYFSIAIDTTKSEKTFTSGIYGQSQQFKKLATAADFGIFGVYLYPYSIPELFSLSTFELSEQKVDLKILCGREGEILEEKVMLANDNFQRANLVSDFIKARLKKTKQQNFKIFHSIKHILHNNRHSSITLLANNCNLSRRQFERVFKEYSGFSPKVFLSLVRFNSIIKEYPKRDKSLTRIGYDYDFYDQSHFIHDFIKFSGYTPKEYFKQNNEHGDYRASVEFK